MRSDSNPVFILGSSRVPFAKSQTAYSDVTRMELMVAALDGLVKNHRLQGRLPGDVALGAVMNSSADFNLAREAVLSTELDPHTPAYNLQRACGTGLEAVWQISLKCFTGSIDFGIAGGVDTNSDAPIEVSRRMQRALLDFNKAKSLGERVKALARLTPKALLPRIPTVTEPRTLLSMGQHCELMVKEWGITRAEQDELAMTSQRNAAKAYDEGFFDDLIVPFHGLKRDATVRGDTTMEKLAKLKPAFDPEHGSLTAGNSSPLTDGAACVLVGNQKGADLIGAKPLARLIDVEVAAVNFVKGEGLLMAPPKAIARLLTRNRLSLADFDYFEVHEAFAGQVLCNLQAMAQEKYCREVLGLPQALGIVPREKLNIVGSSLAVGHPFAATGARIVGTLAKLLSTRGGKRGLISICTAGGMGIAGILESV